MNLPKKSWGEGMKHPDDIRFLGQRTEDDYRLVYQANSYSALVAEVARLEAQNQRYQEILDAANVGDIPKGWDTAIDRAEKAEARVEALSKAGLGLYALAVDYCRNKGWFANPALDEWRNANEPPKPEVR